MTIFIIVIYKPLPGNRKSKFFAKTRMDKWTDGCLGRHRQHNKQQHNFSSWHQQSWIITASFRQPFYRRPVKDLKEQLMSSQVSSKRNPMKSSHRRCAPSPKWPRPVFSCILSLQWKDCDLIMKEKAVSIIEADFHKIMDRTLDMKFSALDALDKRRNTASERLENKTVAAAEESNKKAISLGSDIKVRNFS